MTLYEIDEKITSLIDPETGELLDYEAFEQLQLERDKKIENMALWVKDLKAEASALNNEISALMQRKNSAVHKAEQLMKYIEKALNGEKFKTARCMVSYRKSTSIEVSDTDAFINWAKKNGREDLLTHVTTFSKKAIADCLKNGEIIPFASFVTKNNVGVK